ncbi:somatostatin receptor type 5-like [Ptychodera flava]|uniref:somatostatin receptor type 5-like n=1 Tax=Ptychodera flava TaxID=63121 RepID=UPI00396A6EA0
METSLRYSTSATNLSYAPNDYYDSWDLYNASSPCMNSRLQGMVGLTITSFGIPINVTFMFVVLRVRSMRTVTNAYLVNVAVADVMHLATHWAVWCCHLLQDMCPLRSNMNVLYLSLFLNRIMQFASLLTVTVLALDRYLAVCKPVLYKKGLLHRPRVVVKILSAIWFFSLLMSLETVLQSFGYYHQTLTNYVLIGPLIFLIVLLASVLVTGVFYYLIIHKVRKAARNKSTTHALRSREKQIVRLCMATTAIYFLCVVPMLVEILDHLFNYNQQNRWFFECEKFIVMNVASYFLEINSSVNPIIYNALSSKYRKAFAAAFCMTCQK